MPPAKLNIIQSADKQIVEVFDPHVVGDVNDSQVKVAKFGDFFDVINQSRVISCK